ncbi:hypothetical protein CRE_04006 [Caenorhabditis remanei]|uniref:Nucleoporin Nup120/160 beta-propeller domain-containing protein n=1 Tax=Caenorhabditis remanei TaxID=31234 RepID=E3LYB7_CAERE|nr:hypothetical protein CRE_04006 [Caenorhabditis remanei]
MDLVYGTELTFGDGFAVEYWHIFGIQSNGPLNTNILETEPSGGIATFPDIKNFSDRIFIWRAMGNKLYIEERSTLYSLTDNSICMDVGRSYIIPGTSITFFKQGVLSIVVPTATSVHRFYKAITSKPDNTGSLLHRLFEDEGFSIYETKFELRTEGRPIRASVTHHPNKNTVSYITAEGELRFVALGRDEENENVGHEEFRLPELGFCDKWFGRTSRLVSDSCAMRDLSEVSSDKKSGPKSDIIFAVTRDGIVEAWNADNKEQLQTRINLNEYLSPDDPIPRRTDDSKRSDTDDSTSTEAGPTRLEYTIKAYQYGIDILIIVGCDVIIGRQSVGIRVHIIKFSNYEMKHLQMYKKSVTDNSMSLVDLELLQTYFPPKESDELVEKEQKCEEKNARTAAQFSLSALFKSSSTQKSYSIQRISFAIQWDTGEVISDLDWHPVRPFLPVPTSDGRNDGDEQKKPFFLIPDASYEQINDVVFNFDLFPFDIVRRGIQIVSDNWDVSETPDGTQRYFKDISDGEWNVLYNFVQSYLNSPEYKQKFNKPSPELKSMSSKQKHQALYQDFWWKYLEVCQQLDFNARGVISLSPIQISGNLRIMAVIHRDRMTILEEVNTELLNLLMMNNKEKLKLEPKFPKELDNEMTALIEEASLIADRRVFLMNRYRARVMCSVAGSVPMEDDVKVNPFDFDTDGRFLQITTVQYARIVALTKAFLAAAAYDPTKPYGGVITRDFNGSFTQGLVAVNIRRTVESRVHFALILLSLYNSIKAQNERDGVEPFKIIHSLSRKLKEIIRIYWELKEILDVKITRGGLKLNIETWIVSDDEALGILKREGGYGPNGYKEIRLKDFNWFVKVTTEAAVRAFLSTTEILLVPRLLAERNEYRVLLSLFVQKYVQQTEALKPVFEFYQGIAWSGLGSGQRVSFPRKYV